MEECTAIQAALDTKRETTLSIFYYLRLILVKYRLKALVVAILLALTMINTGIDIAYSYTSPLLEGIEGIDPNIVALVVPIFSILGGVVAILLVEPCGRKSLLLTSAIVLTGSLVSLACYFFVEKYILDHLYLDSNWFILWPRISIAVYSFSNQGLL